MSAIDPRTVDPAKPHPSGNMGHEMSDFSWTTVLWLLPISIIALIAFTLVCLWWFRGAKTTHVIAKESQFSTAELSLHRAKESEFLGEYKILDKEKGRIRIPIQRAMDLMVQENQGKAGADWAPITDIYLQGRAFGRDMRREFEPQSSTGAAGEAKVPEGKAAQPAQEAEKKLSEESAPGGGAAVDPKKAVPEKAAPAAVPEKAAPAAAPEKAAPAGKKAH